MSLVCPGVFLLGVGLVPAGFFFSRTHRACGLVYDYVFLFSGCHPRLTIVSSPVIVLSSNVCFRCPVSSCRGLFFLFLFVFFFLVLILKCSLL